MVAHIISRGGWSSLEHDVTMLQYAARVCGKDKAKILYLNTASSSTPRYIEGAQRNIEAIGCVYSTLDLFSSIPSNYEDYIKSHNVVYVGGGNTRSMIALWKEYGLDKIFKEASNNGVVLTGFSAGAICWFAGQFTEVK